MALPLSLKKNSGWEARCRVLFSQVEQFDRTVRGLFADTGVTGDGMILSANCLGHFPLSTPGWQNLKPPSAVSFQVARRNSP
jgi:hypothetical protein